MNRSRIPTACLLGATLVAGGCSSEPRAPAFPQGDVVDLSHAYGSKTIFWPTAEPFRLEKVADGVTEGGYYYAANNFFSAEHGGTHIDAPVHFAKGHQSVDQIPLDRLMGEALVIDVVDRSEADRDYQVGAEDFRRWEREHGEIGSGAVVST